MNSREPERVLVHAPYGRDAAIVCQVLERSAIAASVCASIESLCESLGEDTGAALISDESLTRQNVAALADILNCQPPWSDLPLIITTSGGEADEASRRRLALLEPLGNVTLLERPLRIATLVSSVHIALRARRRQYQLRENFAERERLVLELERSNAELAQFAHIVSHDLQAPVRMVRNFSELLSRRYRDQLDETGETFIHMIQEGSATMEALIRNLLNYATVGQQPLAPTAVEMSSVVDAVLTTLQPNLEELGAKVSYLDLPTVLGDRVQLQQLIQNLIGNALKYSRNGVAPRICVASEQTGTVWKMSVSDNGPGIPREFHERIFQPLKRLHGPEISGTGLGLAVCRKIVERHGGRIWVESELGQGATFYFTLPPAEGFAPTTNSHDRRHSVTTR